MSLKSEEENVLVEIYIPSVTKEGKRIPPSKIQEVMKYIIEKAGAQGLGCNVIHNVEGHFQYENGEHEIEDNKVMRITCKRNPITKKDVTFFTNYLDQESFLIIEFGKCKACFYDGKEEEIKDYEITRKNGSMVRYFRDKLEDGTLGPYSFAEYDENGECLGTGKLPESEIMSGLERGDSEMFQMLDHFDAA